MTLRISTAMRNFLLDQGSLKDALQNGKLKIYSGSQPATADAAPTGSLLATITAASGAHTAEVQATGTVTLAGSSGSVDALTVGGISVIDAAVAFNTDLATTAADLAAAINNCKSVPNYTATASNAVVTIKAPLGMGAGANGLVVDATCTTMTSTDVNMSGGVTAVNGLKLASSASGGLDKLATQAWSGVSAAGTAGWFRFESALADSGALDSTASQLRLDGAIATSGSQLNLSSTAFAASATQTITAFPVTQPAA